MSIKEKSLYLPCGIWETVNSVFSCTYIYLIHLFLDKSIIFKTKSLPTPIFTSK